MFAKHFDFSKKIEVDQVRAAGANVLGRSGLVKQIVDGLVSLSYLYFSAHFEAWRGRGGGVGRKKVCKVMSCTPSAIRKHACVYQILYVFCFLN